MTDRSDEVLPELESLYEAERALPDPDSDAGAAWERLAAAIPGDGSGAPPSGATGGGAYGAAHLVAALAVGLAIGGAIGAMSARSVDGPAPHAPTAPDGPARVPTEITRDAGTPLAPVVRTEPAPEPTPVPERVTETSDRLAAERRLVDAARFALARGDSRAALDALEQHRRRHREGALAEERDGIEVHALLRAGNPEQARVRAEAFVRRYPESLLRPGVERAFANP